MKAEQFAPGDVVELRSGGPSMTVMHTYETQDPPKVAPITWVRCCWWNGPDVVDRGGQHVTQAAGEFTEHQFIPETLRLMKRPER